MKIPHKNTNLDANIFPGGKNEKCVLFLCGGGLDIGKERFLEWQLMLQEIGISSVSFDYTGVPGSRDSVRDSSLQSRIEEVIKVVEFINEKLKPSELVVYGVSMGGYIALEASFLFPDFISKLVLHAPAAYARNAHEFLFDDSFTKAISRPSSWVDSSSFTLMEQFKNPILFIRAENDEVIPDELTDHYLSIGNKKSNFTHVCLKNASHRCWSNSKADAKVRKDIFTHLVNFI